jgi:hypothetical protein
MTEVKSSGDIKLLENHIKGDKHVPMVRVANQAGALPRTVSRQVSQLQQLRMVGIP